MAGEGGPLSRLVAAVRRKSRLSNASRQRLLRFRRGSDREPRRKNSEKTMRFTNLSLLGLVLLVTACGSTNDEGPATGGSSSAAGSTAVGGHSAATGGKSTAGTSHTGGSSAPGSSATGGVTSSGGAGTAATGGASSSGGSSPGGSSNSGGSPATGGSNAAGTSNLGGTSPGGSSATGGSKATGGSSTTAGATSTGGRTATSGSTTVGGTSTAGGTGATGGMSNTGGTAATAGASSIAGAFATGGGSAQAGATSNTGGTSSSIGGATSSTGGVTGIGGSAVATGGTSSETGGTASTGGLAAAGGETATGGATASGGVTATGGLASTGGASAAGGGGGTGAVAGWTCDPAVYNKGDNVCDCGCGAHDPDCDAVAANPPDGSNCAGDSSSPDCCTTFTLTGSCVRTSTGFPYDALNQNDNSHCLDVPAGWTCAYVYYGDNACDCGCGVVDLNCSHGNDPSSCKRTGLDGSCAAIDGQSVISSNDIGLCQPTVPNGWKCSLSYYNDGICHCGCGIPDPDCGSNNAAACQFCVDEGSCASVAQLDCTAISDADNSKCKPGTWTCKFGSATERDGSCDCGCGVLDPDCDATSPTSTQCATCGYPGSCAVSCDQISPTNPAICGD